jgi:TonB family protein
MGLCGWESQAGGQRVLMSAPVVRELRMLAIEGFVALPKRGVEVGGILFGTVSGATAQIEGFEEAPCEHRYGPSYALSETDRAQLRDLLAQRRGDPSRTVIGFFRSFTSRDPVIEAADEEFVRENFPRGDFLYLMLQPLSAENCVATFRSFNDGELQPETDEQPFAFDPARMPSIEPARMQPESELETLEVEAPFQPMLPPAYRALPDEARTKKIGFGALAKPYLATPRSRWWIPLVACLTLGIGGAVVYELWKVAREPRWAELHLDARPAGRQLEVSWDGSAPAAVSATRALLSVTDGETHHEMELNPAQIRSGRYTYTPSQGNVGFRLILYGKGIGVAGDAVRVTAIPNLIATPVDTQAGDAARTTAEASPPAAGAPPASTAARILSPPSTVHEVQPNIPEGIRSRIREQIVIPVEVAVNERGRVTGATVSSAEQDGLHRYLAEQAQKAARQWRFTPARAKGGSRAAANKTIHFVFTP